MQSHRYAKPVSETYVSEHQGTRQLYQLLHGDASPLTDACGICTVVHHMQQREEQRHKPEPRTEIDLQHPFIAAQPKYNATTTHAASRGHDRL